MGTAGRRRRTEPVGGPLRVVGYTRVSTAEQGDSGAGLAAQRATITATCASRGWALVAIHEDVASGRKVAGRPGLSSALEALEAGRADALVVAKLDRLSRSMFDAVSLLARAGREGWKLVPLDAAVDTTTPSGEAMAHMMATFAQLERRLIGQRTRDALAEKRAEGKRLGRPSRLPADVVARIVDERSAGRTQAAIAEGLNRDGVPTGQKVGARWYQGTVRVVLNAAERPA